MCGIAGAIGLVEPATVAAVGRMSAAQTHRGPDSSGLWTSIRSDGSGVALAFRRLAIIDLSDAAKQPMSDPETGNVLVFNGEIYNFRSLREELERSGARFDSRSDSEVILKAYARWGPECLGRLRGMFAFALWDAARRELLLARDRLGIKPLYLGVVARAGGGRTLLFASEVRALLASGLIDRRIDPVGLAAYGWNGWVIGPRTMVRGVELLAAGTYAAVAEHAPDARVRRRYWRLGSAEAGSDDARTLEEALTTAVAQHLVSDVPVGVFLSGGIDSSAVAALAVRAGKGRVRTFTIGFDDPSLDESRHASAVARALGTEHREVRLTEDDFRHALPDALRSLDQPTFDGLNTYFVSRAVREAGITVAIAGTGGDELFGGYRSFRDVPWAAGWSRRLAPLPMRVLHGLGESVGRALARGASLPPQTRWGKLPDVLAARGELLETYQVSRALFSAAFARQVLTVEVNGALRAGLPAEVADELRALIAGSSPLRAIATCELWCFLGERLLRDTDAASMASSLEVRVPLVDHEVVEAATALTDTERFAPLGRKRVLRELALSDLDPALFERPKSGFVMPIDRWARAALRAEMTEAFRDRDFCEAAGLDPRAVDRLWKAFLAGTPGLYWSRVWALYVLGWWCREHRMRLQ